MSFRAACEYNYDRTSIKHLPTGYVLVSPDKKEVPDRLLVALRLAVEYLNGEDTFKRIYALGVASGRSHWDSYYGSDEEVVKMCYADDMKGAVEFLNRR